MFVIPAVPYLQALGLPRDALIQAMGLSFTVSTVALGIGLYYNDSYPYTVLGASALMLLPALAGLWLGQTLRRRLSPDLFRRVFLSSLLVLGAYMVFKAI